MRLTVIADFLRARRHLAHHCSAGHLQVSALVVSVSWHEEELLLESDEGLNACHSLLRMIVRTIGKKGRLLLSA
jgi:hypothetical protein